MTSPTRRIAHAVLIGAVALQTAAAQDLQEPLGSVIIFENRSTCVLRVDTLQVPANSTGANAWRMDTESERPFLSRLVQLDERTAGTVSAFHHSTISASGNGSRCSATVSQFNFAQRERELRNLLAINRAGNSRARSRGYRYLTFALVTTTASIVMIGNENSAVSAAGYGFLGAGIGTFPAAISNLRRARPTADNRAEISRLESILTAFDAAKQMR